MNFASYLPLLIVSILMLCLVFNLTFFLLHLIKPTDTEREHGVTNSKELEQTQ